MTPAYSVPQAAGGIGTLGVACCLLWCVILAGLIWATTNPDKGWIPGELKASARPRPQLRRRDTFAQLGEVSYSAESQLLADESMTWGSRHGG